MEKDQGNKKFRLIIRNYLLAMLVFLLLAIGSFALAGYSNEKVQRITLLCRHYPVCIKLQERYQHVPTWWHAAAAVGVAGIILTAIGVLSSYVWYRKNVKHTAL